MPTYDYVCLACGHEFEAFQNMTETPLKKCPECGGKVKRKIGTGSGLIFKGSGFYITDYKKGKASPAPSGGSSENKPKDGGKSNKNKENKS